MKYLGHRKKAGKKYKRIVAAVAGAAIVSSAMLPGVPFAKAQAAAPTAQQQEAAKLAAAQPANTPTVTQTDKKGENNWRDRQENARKNGIDKNEWAASINSPLSAAKQYADKYGFDARRDSFSLQWRSDTEATVIVRTANGQTYKMRLVRNTDNTWEVQSVRRVESATIVARQYDPVQVVKNNAATFRFDADRDRFTLESQSWDKATVLVTRVGQDFKVDLERRDGEWVITTLRGIGNGRYPATYTPASLFNYQPAVATTNVTDQTVIYSTDQFAGWTWYEEAYPDDLSFGVFFQHPSANGANKLLPAAILNFMNGVNFDQSIVLTANLGTVAAKGYGIGIEKVAQTGNNLTVTVATKSPAPGATNLDDTQKYSYIALDRGTLDFTRTINIAFVDRAGVLLGSYAIVPR